MLKIVHRILDDLSLRIEGNLVWNLVILGHFNTHWVGRIVCHEHVVSIYIELVFKLVELLFFG